MARTRTPSVCKTVKSEACKLLGGEVQRRILGILRNEELPICKIAKKLEMTPQAVHHHIKKLEKAGLVHVKREERCGHLIESYYQATAENFICHTDEPKSESSEEGLRDLLNELNKIGFKMKVNQENLQKLAEIQTRRKKFTRIQSPVLEICTKCGSGDFFLKSGPMNLVNLDHVYHYANLIMMTDEDYEKRSKNERELRKFLLAICQEKPKT